MGAPDTSVSAKVPILEHGEPGTADYVKLIESGVILEYIEDVWGDHGARSRPSGRDGAAVRMFNDAANGLAPWKLITGKDKAMLQQALKDLAKGMRSADRCLQLY